MDLETQDLLVTLVSTLQTLPAARFLPSRNGSKSLFYDLLRLNAAVSSAEFDVERIRPLLDAILDNKSDEVIWENVYAAVTESTPPPRPASSIQQTPWLRSTGSFANSTVYRRFFDNVLKEELGPMYVGVPGFFEGFFGEVADLKPVAQAVFDKCTEGDTPLYYKEGGWHGWPDGGKERDVLRWFAQLTEQLLDFAEDHHAGPQHRRRAVTRPHQPLQGFTVLLVGFTTSHSCGLFISCTLLYLEASRPGLNGTSHSEIMLAVVFNFGQTAALIIAIISSVIALATDNQFYWLGPLYLVVLQFNVGINVGSSNM